LAMGALAGCDGSGSSRSGSNTENQLWVAAAVTTVEVISTAVQAPQFNLTLDHPFLYAIRDDETSELLSIVTLMDPTK
jgi:serine protease inhibitor